MLNPLVSRQLSVMSHYSVRSESGSVMITPEDAEAPFKLIRLIGRGGLATCTWASGRAIAWPSRCATGPAWGHAHWGRCPWAPGGQYSEPVQAVVLVLQIIAGNTNAEAPEEQEWEARKERMAQMEAILMSAINHPNIVRTYKVSAAWLTHSQHPGGGGPGFRGPSAPAPAFVVRSTPRAGDVAQRRAPGPRAAQRGEAAAGRQRRRRRRERARLGVMRGRSARNSSGRLERAADAVVCARLCGAPADGDPVVRVAHHHGVLRPGQLVQGPGVLQVRRRTWAAQPTGAHTQRPSPGRPGLASCSQRLPACLAGCTSRLTTTRSSGTPGPPSRCSRRW